MLTSTGATYTRVAVVQLAYHPAARVDRRSPLEDPLFDPKGGPDSLLPRGEVSGALADALTGLRTRIRNAHNEQLLAKLRAVLAACQAWNVRLVVLPEYSVPWEILGGVADAAGDHEPHAPRGKGPWTAEVGGFNVNAGITVRAGDTEGRERLCRYGARPE